MNHGRQRSINHVTVNSAPMTRLVAGCTLVVVSWWISWSGIRPVADHAFFPLWFGYILVTDAIVALRTGTSPIGRYGWRVVWFFVASIPLWWTFEFLNRFVENWRYHLPREYGRVAYFVLASLAFSTVVPAVLTTSELVRSFGRNPLRRLPQLSFSRHHLIVVHAAGWLMIAATAIWPSYAFPLVWLALIFIIDPIVDVLNGRSIAGYLRRGDWSPVFNLGLGTLICGFFWEMWNVRALPKWTYEIPHVDWLRVFEMPILGYGGYIPFGLEVFVVYQVFRSLARRHDPPEVLVSSHNGMSD